MKSLLVSRRFLPLFLTQFLGAFNDNLFKNALAVLIVFRFAENLSLSPALLVTVAAGIFIFPFFVFSALAGEIADKYDRARVARGVKMLEILIMLVAAESFISERLETLFIALFFMGVHSAFFGPIKYALLPQHLQDEDLRMGNALVGAGTFIAILLGTICGGLLAAHDHGTVIIALACIAAALAGYAASRFIPAAPAPAPALALQVNILSSTARGVADVMGDKNIRPLIWLISWFWFLGATYLAQFPAFVKNIGGDEKTVTLFLTLFSVGVALGALGNGRLKKPLPVAVALLGMAVFGVDLYFAAHNAALWRLCIDIVMIAVSGGFYIVPLYTRLQKTAAADHMARTIAGLNIMNALYMVASSLFAMAVLAAGFQVVHVFLAVAVMNVLAYMQSRAFLRREAEVVG